MKGLILKDLYSVRFQIIVGALIGLYPNILMMIGYGDFIIGASNTLANVGLTFMYAMMSVVTIVPFSSLMINTLTSDVESGWLKICRTMPVSTSQIVGAKTISTAIIIGIFVLLSIIMNVISILRGAPVFKEVMFTFPICCGLIQMITLTPVFPISMKSGAKKAGSIYLLFMIVLFILAIIVAFATFSGDLPSYALRLFAYVILPALAFTVIFASFKSSKNLISCDI